MLPDDQLCAVITAPGGPETLQLQRHPVPTVFDDEVLIRVAAAGVNRHDCNQRRRGPTPAHSDVPGLEVSGTVVRAGRLATAFQVGQAVCALVDGGGYAQYAVAKLDQVLPIPAGLGWVEAAAVPEAAFTVWHNFFNIAQLGPARSVLLHGGTSGVGVMAVQWLTALGHPVFVTCGSAEKMAVARKLGAVGAFNYRTHDFVAALLEQTDARGVDAILDMSGGMYAERNLDALARRGHILHLSPGNGARFDVPLRAIMAKEARVTGSLLRSLPDAEKAAIARELLRSLWPMLQTKRVQPIIHATLPLTEVAQAHTMMEAGEHIGKIVLTTP